MLLSANATQQVANMIADGPRGGCPLRVCFAKRQCGGMLADSKHHSSPCWIQEYVPPGEDPSHGVQVADVGAKQLAESEPSTPARSSQYSRPATQPLETPCPTELGDDAFDPSANPRHSDSRRKHAAKSSAPLSPASPSCRISILSTAT